MKTSRTRQLARHTGLGLALVTSLGLWVPKFARAEEPARTRAGGTAEADARPEAAAPVPAASAKPDAPAAGGEGDRPPAGGGYTLAGPAAGAAGSAGAPPVHDAPATLAHAGQPTPSNCPVCPVSNKEEVAVLMQLRERHTLLSARENLVAQKEATLAKLEASIDAQLTRFDVALGKVEARLEVGDAKRAKREAQVQALVQTLQGLSAKKAAPMLAEAQPDLVAELFRQLGPVRVASLLSVMPPAKAGKLIDLSVDRAAQKHRSAASPPTTKAQAAAPNAAPAPTPEGAK